MTETSATLADKTIKLTEEEISRLQHEIKKTACKLSKIDLRKLIDTSLDQVMADPTNELLKNKASIVATMWLKRYPKDEEN